VTGRLVPAAAPLLMADSHAESGELVFCHNCENEWMKDDHGLECPECHSDIVEIVCPMRFSYMPVNEANLPQIDPSSDPRGDEAFIGLEEPNHDDRPPPYPRSSPWGDDAPDPDEGDIRHVEYGGPGGMRFSSTTYVRSGPYGSQQTRVVNGADLFPQLLGNLLGSMQPQVPNHDRQPGEQRNQREATRSPLQDGPFRMGSPPRMQSNIRITTSGFGPGGVRTTNIASDDIMGIFGSLLNSVGGAHPGFTEPGARGFPGGPPPGNPLGLLAQILNPANARSGDAVFTNEALDRVITQLMEQHGGSTAPGPASEAAIAALPKIKVTKEHLGENGLAECSICMESVEVGGEVTELPCKHWFHGDCVGPWLHEHDTCPQCRRGITPKDGDTDRPRATGQAPRFWQMADADFRPDGMGRSSNPTTPSAGPSRQPTQQTTGNGSPRSEHESPRSRSSSTRSPRQGSERPSFMSGLMDRFRGSGNNSTSSSHNHGPSSHRRRSRSQSDHGEHASRRHHRHHRHHREGSTH
jgi:E3 ubiquitin-protein ligase RNF115/126